MRTINRDFIGVIKEEKKGLLKYEEIAIPYPKELIEGIEAICQKDDTTIMDVQELYWKYFPNEKKQERQKSVNYLYPHNYDSILTSKYAKSPIFYNANDYPFKLIRISLFPASIPEYRIYPSGFISRDEYEKALNNQEQLFREKNFKEVLKIFKRRYISNPALLEEIHKLEESNYNYQTKNKILFRENEKISERTLEIRKKLILDLRDSFANETIRYILGQYYEDIKDKISKSVLMFSTDAKGSTRYEYNISSDVRIEICSNYGYGSKSYHYCNLYYKDIPILPYTNILYYNYSISPEIIHYTRSYYLKRDACWEQTFHFVKDISNLIKCDSMRFINQFIIGEIETMVNRLEDYYQHPKLSYEDSLVQEDHLINNKDEYERKAKLLLTKYFKINKEIYLTFPEDYITICCEKISGSLDFMENLKQLTIHLPKIQEYIDRIIALCTKIGTEIVFHIEKLLNDILIEEKKLKKEKKEKSICEDRICKYEKTNKVRIKKAYDKYIKGEDEKKIEQLTQSIQAIERRIRIKSTLLDRDREYKERIVSFLNK